MFPCEASFSGVFDKIFIEVPQFHKPPAPCLEKFLVAHLHSGIIVFAKRSILNVWQYSEYVSFSTTAQ